MNKISQWKNIYGYSGLYKVNINGQVYSFNCNKMLKHSDNNGYKYVTLYKNKKGKPYYIHRLVAKAFIKNKNKLRVCVNHKDGNKNNNSASNLEWCSYKENMKHAIKNKLNASGRQIHLAKLNMKKAINIRREYNNGNISQRALAKRYNVCQRTITMIVNNITWRG